MKIRLKITLQFVIISAIITFVAFVMIYVLSANYRHDQFIERLTNKAITTAKLLVDVQEIDENILRIIDENTPSMVEERVVIYNYDNELVYSSLKEDEAHDSISFLNLIRLEQNISFSNKRSEGVGLLYVGEFDRFVVVASALDLYGLEKLNNLRLILIFVFLGILLLTSVAGWIYSGEALKPITHVIEEVKQINDQSMGLRVNEGNGTDEIAELAKTFNLMLDRLEAAFYSQKSFVSHASHELRTPLTAIKGQIDVILLKNRTAEEYQETLISIHEDISELSRLTNGLLDLAQADTRAILRGFEELRIDDILFQAMEQANTKYSKKSIGIEFENFPESEDELLIKGSFALLKSALFNLLDNACKFSEDKEVKTILINELKTLTIKVVDKGIGINPEEKSRIFEPFYRASNTQSFKGYGLGLPLTKKILDMHNASIGVTSVPGGETIFSVSFSKIHLII